MLNEGDKALIKEIAWEVGGHIEERLKSGLHAKVEVHLATCPVKAKVDAMENKAKGAWRVLAAQVALILAILTLAIAIWQAIKTH